MGKSQIWGRPSSTDLINPHTMPAVHRWQLYFHFLHLYSNNLRAKLETCNQQFRTLHKQYAEIRDIEDINLMKEMHVV